MDQTTITDDKQPFDFEAMPPAERYRIAVNTVVPRPIGWITSESASGVVNVAPFSFFNIFCDDPVVVVLGLMAGGPGAFKHTAANILQMGEFVAHVVPERLAEAMNTTCADMPEEVSEAEVAGLHTVPSTKVRPPRLAESPAALECRVMQTIPNGNNGVLVISRVVMAHLSRTVLSGPAERPQIDTAAMGLIARMHGRGYYARTTDLFDMPRPGRWTPPSSGSKVAS